MSLTLLIPVARPARTAGTGAAAAARCRWSPPTASFPRGRELLASHGGRRAGPCRRKRAGRQRQKRARNPATEPPRDRSAAPAAAPARGCEWRRGCAPTTAPAPPRSACRACAASARRSRRARSSQERPASRRQSPLSLRAERASAACCAATASRPAPQRARRPWSRGGRISSFLIY